jgi:magnesium chelatase family protein
MPRMTIDEALDVTRIYSVADQFPPNTLLIQNRPFRAPHHIISHAGPAGAVFCWGEAFARRGSS